MDTLQARKIIKETFENSFDRNRFIYFMRNLLNDFEEDTFSRQGNYIPEAFKNNISTYERIGKYSDGKNRIDLLIVYLNKDKSIERARSMQRNFVAGYLQGKYGSSNNKEAALVAFVSPGEAGWRFSLVKMDYRFEESEIGKIKVKEEFTPARRWSFLVGPDEASHTAQSRLVNILADDKNKPALEQLEDAFNIETVTKEFFFRYRELFIRTKDAIDKIIKNNEKIKTEFESKGIDSVNFSKKLLGQIVFLYFLQRKGWFGVPRNGNWGTGSKKFLREMFEKKHGDYTNFFNDILEPLFYEALRIDRSHDDHYYSRFNCKIPFLNGGLFDPIGNYDWVQTDITLPNDLFSNNRKTAEGDIGDGILDIFDRYNFTVCEDEPLEKEVAIDPELLGKAYERFNAIRSDNYDEYLKALKEGQESKFNKTYGVYYTPREIVHYMCRQSLVEIIHTRAQENNLPIPREDIEKFIDIADHIHENEEIANRKQKAIEDGQIKESSYKVLLPDTIRNNAGLIDGWLAKLYICDPAAGSGAFPVGLLTEVLRLRRLLSIYTGKTYTDYELKRQCIENSIYGVDIDPGAVEIARLRLWLSLVVDEEDIRNIKPLPNLDYKIVCGNSLLGVERNIFNDQLFADMERLKPLHLNETNPTRKNEYKAKIQELIYQITSGHSEFDFNVYFSEVFHLNGGFDVVIGNPPYISTKGIDDNFKKVLEKQFGFADDTYNHFYFKGIKVLKNGGVLAYISSKTFWTIQTKKNLRQLILQNKLLQLFDTANPFESAMVDTCVTLIQKTDTNKNDNYEFIYLNGKNSLSEPIQAKANIEVYKFAPNQVFFPITDYNLKIYHKYGKKVNDLLNTWWDKISTSKNIDKNKQSLEQYRQNLKPGDLTLLGLITEGGQGLATANNGKYVGVLEGTKWADNVREQRPEKLLLASAFCKKEGIKTKADAEKFLKSMSENEIRELFDSLKEKYGRDVFGQGWLYRIVSPDEIADVESLTEDEKLNGIKGKRTFVPYDKGDKDGNRWWAPTPYYIDWSRENVKFLKENSGKKGEGMPVVRNPQFYFREGFCWSDIHTVLIRCRNKTNGIHDVKSMSLFSLNENLIPSYYLICLINSTFLSEYDFNFVNNTQTFQINDARQLPIIIPTCEQLKFFESIFNRAVGVQKEKFAGKISENEAEERLKPIQEELDRYVEEMYMGKV